MEAVKGFLGLIMGQMMPYMKIPLWIGLGLLALGVIFLVMRFMSGNSNSGLLWSGRILFFIGIFYVACQVMGLWLGADPIMSFGGDPKNFDFGTLVDFWKIGVAFLIPALIFGFFTRQHA